MMVDEIINAFLFLTTEKGYSLEVKQITYVFKNVIFSNGYIKVKFECELMEDQFDFEIVVQQGNKKYSICEFTGRCKLHYENRGDNNIIHKNIFEFTKDIWNEDTFQKEKENIYKSKYLLNTKKKKFLQFVFLYKKLLIVAIENIENCFII